MVDSYAILDGCAGGAGWKTLIKRWTELERAYGFETSSRALPTKGRPLAVGAWTKSGRQKNKPPAFVLDKFVKDWGAWWTALGPDWREKDTEGRLLQRGHGPWGGLVHPGANGILMVLLGLAWWRDKEWMAASETWEAAVRDVGWVVGGLLANARWG
ncbi:hypothetical protein B0H11DRAFT_1768087 [Mycena galericulata]|nr:hypothetical protein B0H11DRAFT_1768087 [Mycena galericulata]